ncbi:MAG: hypothetical protein ACI9FD_003863 [Gammaproteobacteria bacterium]|jgi:hypothetical protein
MMKNHADDLGSNFNKVYFISFFNKIFAVLIFTGLTLPITTLASDYQPARFNQIYEPSAFIHLGLHHWRNAI